MNGPVEQIPLADGSTADLYLLRFDKDGGLLSRDTAAEVVAAAAHASDVFLISHGWNTVYDSALDHYRAFARGFIQQRADLQLPTPPGYRPLVVGVIWPSAWFVTPGEQGPDIAGGVDDSALNERLLGQMLEEMDADSAAAFAELVDGAGQMSTDDARRAAALLRDALWPAEDPDSASPAPDTDTILSSWQAMSGSAEPFVPEEDAPGTVIGEASAPGGPGQAPAGAQGPAAAGIFSFNPRDLVRLGSVWTMKRRAGRVGVNGVAPVLGNLLGQTSARVHLVGHSFGARVVLSAAAAQPLPRNLHSVLLLQPAINRWCFAEQVIGTTSPGGYRVVLDRVDQPVVHTQSTHDVPLHEFFHLAVRGGSLGEIDIAAVGDTDRFGALGGYGPQMSSTEVRRVMAHAPADRYDLSGPARVVAIDGSGPLNGTVPITGHGDISNPTTWWALHCLVDPMA